MLARARIAAFRDILAVLDGRNVRDVLVETRRAALCLRGCFVTRKGALDIRRPSAAERYDASRILILSLFRATRVVTNRQAEGALGDKLLISEAAVRGVLAEVAELRRGVGWELKVDDDESFIRNNPGVIRLSEAEWDKKIVDARKTLEKHTPKARRRPSVT